MIERYRRWFEYEIDAHAKVLASLESVPAEGRDREEFKRAVSILGHVVAARRVWLFRLGIAPTPQGALFPETPDVAAVAATWNEAAELWKNYLGKLTDADLEQYFEYQSLDAGRFRNKIEDVLTQLFLHSSYHRGQIAMLVKSAGGTPAVTDLIFWCREGIG